MGDQNSAMLQYAAAVPGPLWFRIHRADGQTTDHQIATPFAIAGRGENCDLHLPDPNVAFRHVYLQAIGNRLACIDLLSANGISGAAKETGWLAPQAPVQVGDCRIELLGDFWYADPTLTPPLEFRPRDEFRPEYGMLPQVELELSNTSKKGARWPINRVITLVGREQKCRITMMDERVSRVHCSLLLLPSGLWVIDTLGKGGIQLNGEVVRCGLLATGTELTIGPYRLQAHYSVSAMSGPPMPPAEAALPAHAANTIPTEPSDFLTRTNRILQTESYQDSLIVFPAGDSNSFLYQEIHIEANRILDLISRRGFQNLIVDFSRCEATGQLVLDALLSISRAIPGRTILCGASEENLPAVQKCALGRLHTQLPNRDAALHATSQPG